MQLKIGHRTIDKQQETRTVKMTIEKEEKCKKKEK